MSDTNTLINLFICKQINQETKELKLLMFQEKYYWQFRQLNSLQSKKPFDSALDALIDFIETEREVIDLLYEWQPVTRPQEPKSISDTTEESKNNWTMALQALINTSDLNARIVYRETGYSWGLNKGSTGLVSEVFPSAAEALVSLIDYQEKLIARQRIHINYLSDKLRHANVDFKTKGI